MGMANTQSLDAASFAPLAVRGDHNHPAHVVQFYGEDRFLLDELSRFIGTALGAGDAAVVLATKAHRDGLVQRFEARGLDAGVAIEQGRYVPLDAPETLASFMRDAWPDAELFTQVGGSVLGKAAAA